MLAMMVLERGSTGSPETTLFQALLAGNGRFPPRLALAPEPTPEQPANAELQATRAISIDAVRTAAARIRCLPVVGRRRLRFILFLCPVARLCLICLLGTASS